MHSHRHRFGTGFYVTAVTALRRSLLKTPAEVPNPRYYNLQDWLGVVKEDMIAP